MMLYHSHREITNADPFPANHLYLHKGLFIDNLLVMEKRYIVLETRSETVLVQVAPNTLHDGFWAVCHLCGVFSIPQASVLDIASPPVPFLLLRYNTLAKSNSGEERVTAHCCRDLSHQIHSQEQ